MPREEAIHFTGSDHLQKIYSFKLYLDMERDQRDHADRLITSWHGGIWNIVFSEMLNMICLTYKFRLHKTFAQLAASPES